MASCTPKLKKISQRLLAHEESSGSAGRANHPAGFRVCQKLLLALRELMGSDGSRALLTRALGLAAEEVPWLRELQVGADGLHLEANERGKPTESEAAGGEAVLVAHLLGLLVTFIGPALTAQIVADIWPKMEDLNF